MGLPLVRQLGYTVSPIVESEKQLKFFDLSNFQLATFISLVLSFIIAFDIKGPKA